MERQKLPVVCPENEEIAEFLWNKRLQMADSPKGIPENIDMTLYKAYFNVCNSKTSIKSLKDLSQIKGVGKWILKQAQEFFKTGSEGSEPKDLSGKGKKTKGTKRYVPQKNSVAYALLITLYRSTTDGNEYMRKQDLIDAAEASGLSRVAIGPEKGKGKGKPGQFGSSPRDWYTGWSCMKTLVSRGLVVKSSCPAKYMLTQEGQQVACECLVRSGLSDSKNFDNAKGSSVLESHDISDCSVDCLDSDGEVSSPSVGVSRQSKSIDVPLEPLERFMRMGYSKQQVLRAYEEVLGSYPNKDISSLWPAVLCCLREDQVYGQVDPSERENRSIGSSSYAGHIPKANARDNGQRSFTLRACSSSNRPIIESSRDCTKANMNILSMPPLSFGEKFEDAYNIVMILDDREQFANHGSRSSRMIENICSQFKIQIEIRRLPVGDGIWIARHKHLHNEYVLDFIVERKNVNDLRSSIRDNRYRDQKLRLLRCGLKKMIYLVEGDPNSSEAAESIKTACFTTEILEGFDVQRTSGLADTLKKYGHLTHAISQYYMSQVPDERFSYSEVCPRLDDFIKSCQELDKMTVSDVFALQLMQVPQVTEGVAIAVLDLYPTLLSLARAYSHLDGDVSEQEEMLRKQSNSLINAGASRNIFHLVWGSGK